MIEEKTAIIEVPDMTLIEPGKRYRIDGKIYIAETGADPCRHCAFYDDSRHCGLLDCILHKTYLKQED